MFGAAGDKKFKAKGAETWALLLFVLDVFERHHASIEHGPAFLRGARSLVGLVRLWHSCGVQLTSSQIQSSFDLYIAFLEATDELSMESPKRHLAMHLLETLSRFGNPLRYMNWIDESLNKTLKSCARQVSQTTFEVAVLSAIRQCLRTRVLPAKRRFDQSV